MSARSGWPGGVGRRPVAGVDRGVQVRDIPGPLVPVRSETARFDRYVALVGVAGWGGVDGLLAGVDRGVQVRGHPGPLVPGKQRGP